MWMRTKEEVRMEKIKAEEIRKILGEHGTVVTLEEAQVILEFMKKLAKFALEQYLSL